MKKKPDEQPENIVIGRNGGRLKRLKKGDPSPNPNGRPKGSRNRSTVVREFLDAVIKSKNPISGKDENLTVEQRMALSMIAQVITKGNVNAWNSIKDDAYGKLKEYVDHTSDGEKIQPILNAPVRLSFDEWEKKFNK